MFTLTTMLCLALASPGDLATAPVLAYQAQLEAPREEVHGSFDSSDEDLDLPPRRSYLSWLYYSLGIKYSLLLPLSGFMTFLGACIVVALARPAVIASYLVLLPLPLLISIFGGIEGLIAAWNVLAMSSVSPSPSELASGYSSALVTPLVGFLVNAPAYFVIALGLPLRVYFARSDKA